MSKKNKAAVAVLAILVVTLILFISLVMPVLFKKEEEVAEPVETQPGESIGMLGKYQIYDPLTRDQIKRILVHNKTGEYAFVKDKTGAFVIEGMEGLPYNEVYLSALIAVVGNPLALEKVSSNADRYEEYGLSDSDVYFEVTSTDGTVRRVTVGHMLHTAGGYYVSYEGRDAVYVLGGDLSVAMGDGVTGGTSLDQTVLQPVEFYVTPVLIAGIDSNYNFLADKFTIFHGDEDIFLSAKIVDPDKQTNPDALVENVLVYPAAYQPNSETFYNAITVVTALSGTRTVLAGADSEEDYDRFGLKDPGYVIYYVYEEEEYFIRVSEALENGSYYATSSMNPTVVVEVPAETLGFLEMELLYWIEPYILNHDITSIEELSVSGKDISYSFVLNHGTSDKGKPTLTVEVTDELTGEFVHITDEDMVWHFRSFYRTMLYGQIEDEVPLTDAEKEELTGNGDNLVLTYKYTTSAGTTTTLEFWQYSTRRTLMTIDGEGVYYVYLDRVEKVLSDAVRVFNGEPVDSHGKN